MWNAKKYLLMASVALIGLPCAALAQEGGGFDLGETAEKKPEKITTTSVEVGVGYVGTDSFQFGEYSGLGNSGGLIIGNIESYIRAPYDNAEGDTGYLEFRATDLGLDSRSVYLKTGKQGKFSLYFDYDAIPHLQFDDGQTPFIGAGGGELALPPDWEHNATPATMATLAASLRDVEVKTERERVGAGIDVGLTRNWSLSTSFRSEEKKGIETIAGIVGSSGGNMKAAILPKPIDYRTQEAGVNIAYGSDRLQMVLGYSLSLFENEEDSLTWQNPYTNFNPADPVTGILDGEGRLAMEPDNSAHAFSLKAGYKATDSTRITGSLALTRMIQDEDFLPYTINPDLLVPNALPRDSLEGEVNALHASLGLATDLTEFLDLRAEYKYDDRDNQTPVDTFYTVHNDSADQVTTASADWRRNKPYSKQSHKLETELGYDLTADTRLSAGYEFEAVNRDLQEVEDTTEHTLRLKGRSNLTQTTVGRLEYAYSMRTGSTYDTTVPFLAGHDAAYLATLTLPAGAYEQNAYLRKYYMSDRDQHLLRGGLSMFPSDSVALGLSGSYQMADYGDTVVGLTESNYGSATFDASYAPRRGVTLSGFVTYETADNVQVGYQRSGTVDILPGDPLPDVDTTAIPDGTIEQGLWEETTSDTGITGGIELAWTAVPDKLDIAVDYAYSRTQTQFDFVTNVKDIAPLPDLTTTLNAVGVRADYKALDGVTLRLGYRYEKYDVEDFALAYEDEIVSPAVLGLGNGEPSYEVHVVGASVIMKF